MFNEINTRIFTILTKYNCNTVGLYNAQIKIGKFHKLREVLFYVLNHGTTTSSCFTHFNPTTSSSP